MNDAKADARAAGDSAYAHAATAGAALDLKPISCVRRTQQDEPRPR